MPTVKGPTLGKMQAAYWKTRAQLTERMNRDFQSNLVPNYPHLNNGNINTISLHAEGPWLSPTQQTAMLIFEPDKAIFIEKTHGEIGRFYDFSKQRWEAIKITERFDILGSGSMLYADFRAKKPGGFKKVGLVTQLPPGISLESLMPPKEKDAPDTYYAFRAMIARQSNDPKLLAEIFKNLGENKAIRREAYCNPYFDHNIPGLPSPATVDQFLDDPSQWAAPIRSPKEPHQDPKMTANYFPFIPDIHVLAVPRSPFVHELKDLTEEELKPMLESTVQFFSTLKEEGESTFRDQINESRLLRMDRAMGPNEIDGAVIGWNFGSDTLDRDNEGTLKINCFASQEQAHLQIGPLTKGTYNRADRIADICKTFSKFSEEGIDYLGAYLRAIKIFGYELHDFDGTKVIIPFAQRGTHELQVFLPKSKCRLHELKEHDITCLAKAFAFVMKAYKELKVPCFNMMSSIPRFSEPDNLGNRIIFAFVPAMSGTAFSEKQGRWVVASHPNITRDLLDNKSFRENAGKLDK